MLIINVIPWKPKKNIFTVRVYDFFERSDISRDFSKQSAKCHSTRDRSQAKHETCAHIQRQPAELLRLPHRQALQRKS